MEALIIIFIVIVLIVALFCLAIVTREIIIEEKERRANKNKEEQSPVEERTFQTKVIHVEKLEEPKTETVVAPLEEDDSNVKFEAITQTLDEKYHALESAYRVYYDEIVKAAMAVEGNKRIKNDNYEEYKLGKGRIVRLKIKRGVVIAELLIPNLTLKNYISDNKVEAKIAPTVFKVLDQESLNAVKDAMEIAVKVINEEKELKKEQAKERRRLAREAAK